MQEWIPEEAATAHIGDRRLDKRFRIVLNTMSQNPSLKFPAACNGRAETAAAYRFVGNGKVGKDQVLLPHRTATLKRIRAQKVVLIPQDTTELDMTRPREIMAGAGPLNDGSRVGFYDHALLAITPEGVPLGVVAADIWARDFDGFDKDADQKRAERRAKSIEEKESHRWLEGYREACRVAQEAPETLIVCLSDSEGDIYECLIEGQKETNTPQAQWIIRACQDRGLIVDEEAAAGCPTRLRAQVASTPIVGHLTVDAREREPKSNDDRKRKQARAARTAALTMQAARVRLRGPDRPGGKLPNIEVNCVLVTEPNPPEGAEPIEWLLLTSLPFDTVEEVLTSIKFYCCRWQIENSIADGIDFFHVDALSSAVAMKVNCDLQLTLMASSLYRLLAGRIGWGDERAESRHLFQDFVDATAKVTITESEIVVRYQKRAHNPLLVAAGFDTTDAVIPWLGGKRLHLVFG